MVKRKAMVRPRSFPTGQKLARTGQKEEVSTLGEVGVVVHVGCTSVAEEGKLVRELAVRELVVPELVVRGN